MDQLYLLLQKQFQKTYKEMKQTLTTYQELTGGTPDLAPVNDGFPLSDPPPFWKICKTGCSRTFRLWPI